MDDRKFYRINFIFWSLIILGVLGVYLFFFFHPEQVEKIERFKERMTQVDLQSQSNETWQVVAEDDFGKILRFIPNDTMFLDSRYTSYVYYSKMAIPQHHGKIEQLFDADGKPLTYEKYLEQIEMNTPKE